MKRVLFFLATCCLLIPYKLLADDGDKYLQTAVRPIAHATTDSLVMLHVKVSSKGIEKLSDKLFYYWERKGVVHKNQGAFLGNVLHGKYSVVNAKGFMVTEGYFYNGTKDSQWKKWDNSGALTQVDFWKEGHLKKTERYGNGKLTEKIVYGKNGNPKKKIEYNVLGKKKAYSYKAGVWVAKRKLGLKLFSKKQKQTEIDVPTASMPE